ncbi:hypothetical protein AB0C59_13620 [Streptomyces sp. NPDC048664]|uniref:hypothetical protein n=1 Tax=Streptomyces sp. NPDC048664 TaxID=3154505 RepID=UPI0034460F39
MTDTSGFDHAFSRFLTMRYPDYPQLEALQDWNSELLTLDGHVAGYASQVHGGTMRAHEIPDLPGILLSVRNLRESLGSLRAPDAEDRRLISEYASYVSALESMVSELDHLARHRE